ncbi:MAG TPA: LysR substrate-binding domain-containing protein [Burkholderiaceae bacterium]|nr:LysR substrate-binding domain-containing protein [Burkholderiaceae bacterium]
MNLRQLEYFVRVAELGSFSKAAVVLDVAQPALSRHVRALETDLRATLLQRTGRGVTLTDAGRRLFEHGVGILQLVARATEELEGARGVPAGRIAVGLPPSIGRQLTLPLVEAFKQRYPKARLAIVEGFSAHIGEWIASGRVDLGLMYNPEVQPALEIVPVLDDVLCLVQRRAAARRAEPARKAARTPAGPLPLRDLPSYPLIMPERTHALRKLLQTQAALNGLTLNFAWEVASIPSIIDLVCAGYGNAVLTASAVGASTRARELVVRPLVDPSVTSVLCLVQSAHRQATPLVREVAKLLTALVAGLPRAPTAAGKPR